MYERVLLRIAPFARAICIWQQGCWSHILLHYIRNLFGAPSVSCGHLLLKVIIRCSQWAASALVIMLLLLVIIMMRESGVRTVKLMMLDCY